MKAKFLTTQHNKGDDENNKWKFNKTLILSLAVVEREK